MGFNDDDREDSIRNQRYLMNRVTKDRISTNVQDAAALKAQQKYPQNWSVVDLDTCSNCGGGWDGNQDCANYCIDTIVRREEPNPEPTDLGEVSSWEEVFQKCWELYWVGQLDMLATISPAELAKGQWHAPMLNDWQAGRKKIPAEETLRSLAETCPNVYPGNDRFHMFTTDMMIGDSRLHRAYTQLVVVYLKPGEQFVMPATKEVVTQ